MTVKGSHIHCIVEEGKIESTWVEWYESHYSHKRKVTESGAKTERDQERQRAETRMSRKEIKRSQGRMRKRTSHSNLRNGIRYP